MFIMKYPFSARGFHLKAGSTRLRRRMSREAAQGAAKQRKIFSPGRKPWEYKDQDRQP
jgi:hypothetical protein